MLNARLIVAMAILFSVFSFAAPGLVAQQGSTLPPGIQNVEVDGQAIDSAASPTTNNPAPEFSGRTELAIPTIDLIVTGAEPIRFTVELDNRGRFRAAVPQPLPDGQYTLAINDVPVGAFTIDSSAQAAEPEDEGESRTQARPLLDIARMVPYPADFGDSLPGIGFLDGRFYSIDEEAARTAAANGADSADGVRETRRGLASAGWLQRYENRLAAPNTENPDVFDIQFSSFVVEYAFPEDASAAFASLTEDDPVVEFPLVGEESALTLLTGTTPDTGAEYQAARVLYRVGPMLGMIVYADLLGQQPDLALLQSVAQSAAARGAVVVERNTVPLGSMALQLDPSAASGRLNQRDLYDVRAGVLTALFAEDEVSRESRVALFTGTTDAFSATTNGTFAADRGDRERERDQSQEDESELEQAAGWQQEAAPTPTSVISIEGESPSEEPAAAPTSVIAVEGETPTPASVIIVEGETPAPAPTATPAPAATSEPAVDSAPEEPVAQQTAQTFMTSALYAFTGDAEAGAWLDAQRERLVSGATNGSGTFTEVPEAPALGDAAATFATQRPLGDGEATANGFRFYSRVGAIVAVLEIGSTSELPLDNASRFMELQIECIEANGCPGLASLSGRFVAAVEIPERAAQQPEEEQAQAEQAREPRPERQPRDRQQPESPPVEEQPPAPIEEPTPIPIEEPTQPPVEEPTQPPVEEPTAPPVDEGTPPPVDEGTPPPAEEPTPPPAEEPTQPPAEEPTPAPTQPPVEEPTAPPAEEPTAPPVTEPTAIPTPAPDLEETPPEEDGGGGRDRDRDRDRDRGGGRD